MKSNCYIVWDDVTKRAICIDPASEFSFCEIAFIEENVLHLDYIILTHEHTDHTWGVNALLDKYDAKVICSDACRHNLHEAGNMYFRMYYERENYTYVVRQVDFTTESLNNLLDWNGYVIKFIRTPGHSMGSICIDVDGNLFTGDTVMQYKAYVNKRNGSLEYYKRSVQTIVDTYSSEKKIYPGHGNVFLLKDKDNIIKL